MTYSIAVRSLCEFTAKAGDLDIRFTPAPTAQEGMEGHIVLARRRGAGYETEIALESEYAQLRVRGRADGFDARENRLEEFKTYRGDLARIPASHRAVHWAQLRIYGALLCRKRALPRLQLALVYFDIATEEETSFTEEHDVHALERLFTDHCERFLCWARQELAHRRARDEWLGQLRFPFAAFHPRQRELAEGVYRSVTRRRALLAQAPTGIGKTLGTLFPTLKAMPAQLDKIFFLVAKTSGRRVALEALARIRGEAVPDTVRVLELVAREKACEYPDAECEGTSCPLARGFYDRLPAAREEAVQAIHLDRATVRVVALKHGICPYYLSQELTRWADVIVADYNYYFDLSALLYALTQVHQWQVALLVDEAHNLVERARTMYSVQLDRAALLAARQSAPWSLKRAIDKVARQWDELVGAQDVPYRVHEAVPATVARALEGVVAAIGEYAAQQPGGVPASLLDFYFEAGHFCRLAAQFDRDTICDVTLHAQSQDARADLRAEEGGSTICLRNVIPMRFLAARWAAAHSIVLFSATLAPFAFYRDVLGLPADAGFADIGSPFAPEQLSVRVVRSVSTRFDRRAQSIQPIARLIVEHFRSAPGNYLAFFSSFQYLRAVAAHLAPLAGDIPLWCQESGMSEARRDEFLARFEPEGRGIGFAVLGGAFAEGIDLPGKRLIGAFVATLGLPQLNATNDESRRRIEERFGAGFEYTYLYPGLRKVVQAAGRVIRSREDRGVVYLIDDRYARAEVRRLLPRWWVLEEVGQDIRQDIGQQVGQAVGRDVGEHVVQHVALTATRAPQRGA